MCSTSGQYIYSITLVKTKFSGNVFLDLSSTTFQGKMSFLFHYIYFTAVVTFHNIGANIQMLLTCTHQWICNEKIFMRCRLYSTRGLQFIYIFECRTFTCCYCGVKELVLTEYTIYYIYVIYFECNSTNWKCHFRHRLDDGNGNIWQVHVFFSFCITAQVYTHFVCKVSML